MGPRRAFRSIAGVAVALGLGGVAACVLADPPAALPVAPIEAPEIEHQSVQPPIGDILTTWPTQIFVPVAADSRESSLDWQWLIDQEVILSPPRGQDIEADGGVMIDFLPQPPLSLDECHTLEVRVAYPDLTGGDNVVWFYTPTGNFENCPVFDAGPLDAGTDGDASDAGAAGND